MRTIRELLIVRVLTEQRNFGRAASILNMTQPALTRTLQRIENDLGVVLFSRPKTAVAPTEEGMVAQRHLDPMIKGFADHRREIKAPRAHEQSDFTLAFGPFAAEAVGKTAFATCTAKFPLSHGQLLVRDHKTCITNVRDGRADLAVTDLASVRNMPDLEGTQLGREPGRFFCASLHPLARASRVAWAEVVSYPWAFAAVQARFADMIPVPVDKAGRIDRESGNLLPAIRVETFAEMNAAVGNGHAIGLCSPHFVQKETDAGEIALIDLFEPWMQFSYGMIWRKTAAPCGALGSFVGLLAETQRARNEALALRGSIDDFG
ncbi:MAG: LysR family transcriptional regulator [Alphaproteobacteria bacterium]